MARIALPDTAMIDTDYDGTYPISDWLENNNDNSAVGEGAEEITYYVERPTLKAFAVAVAKSWDGDYPDETETVFFDNKEEADAENKLQLASFEEHQKYAQSLC